MFDIAWSELLLIAIVALIFIGPKELPAVLQNMGRLAAKMRRSADEFRRQFEESMRESGYHDLHRNLQDLRSLNPSNQLRATLDSAFKYTPRPMPAVDQLPAELAAPRQPDAPAAPAATAGEPAAQDKASGAAASPEREDMPAQGAQMPAKPAQGAQMPANEPSQDRAAPVA